MSVHLVQRRDRRRWVVYLLAGLSLLLASVTATSAQQSATAVVVATDPRPNIVFISTDDLRVRDLQVMPNVQALITDQGTNFSTSYAPFPLCCPARAAWLTGQYNHNNGVMGNAAPGSEVGGYQALDHTNTLATWLSGAGYQTAYVGRYLNGYGGQSIPPGWHEWHAVTGANDWLNASMRENHTGTLRTTTYSGTYLTDLIDLKSTAVIRDRLPHAQPLFLWVSHFAPHAGGPAEADDPALATPPVPARYKNFYANAALPQDPSFNEADVSDKPAYVRNRAPLSASLQAQIRELNAQRWESLKAADESVGNIMAALQASGELANTVVVFSSDNGYMLGEHRIPAGKVVHYEASSRVPLMIRGPGFPAGAVRPQLVANIDLAPTLADLADTTPGRTVDGRSLLPLAASPTTWPTRNLALEAGPRTVDGPDLYHGVRTPRYKYVRHYTGERELYDMSVDPHELKNLVHDPAYDATEAALDRATTRLATCKGTTACQ
jgi:arylsulfatase A-like enzyme